jgi:hypothetical protein
MSPESASKNNLNPIPSFPVVIKKTAVHNASATVCALKTFLLLNSSKTDAMLNFKFRKQEVSQRDDGSHNCFKI